MDECQRFILAEPPYPPPANAVKLHAAVADACELMADVPQGYVKNAVPGICEVMEKGHNQRVAMWALYRLAAAGAVIVRPRSNIEVVRETHSTQHLIDDERPRYGDGSLIPDGPYPLNPGEPAPWAVVAFVPVYEELDRILAAEGYLETGEEEVEETPAKKGASKAPAEWFTDEPPEVSKFKFGPLVGTIRHICECVSVDRRTLRNHNGISSWWVKRQHNRQYLVWFSSQSNYAKANTTHIELGDDKT